jgi:putative methyltransferase (TIGR04325 family)
MLRSTRLRESVSLGRLGEHALLPLLAATLGTERVRVLDFGGGMGIGYATMRATLPETVHVSYRIIEIPPVCERGRSLYLHGEDVSFLEHLPGSTSAVDIVYSRSALQYVSAYRSVLRTLLGYRARYALFVMLPAGDIPTYASAQTNVPGSILAHWFFNIDEILQIASECGYALAMRAPSDRAMDRSDVPASHRLARASNLLFARRVL